MNAQVSTHPHTDLERTNSLPFFFFFLCPEGVLDTGQGRAEHRATRPHVLATRPTAPARTHLRSPRLPGMGPAQPNAHPDRPPSLSHHPRTACTPRSTLRPSASPCARRQPTRAATTASRPTDARPTQLRTTPIAVHAGQVDETEGEKDVEGVGPSPGSMPSITRCHVSTRARSVRTPVAATTQ